MIMFSLEEWLFQNWRDLLPVSWCSIALAFAAVVCGVIVGSERERREKAAGMKTLILVILGAAVFTMISFAFTTTTGDSGRVAAQIVTGIGFLGAGVIMRGRNTISGTTTAATIWMSAAIGTVVGAGNAGAAVGLSVLVRVVLTGIYKWESRSLSKTRPIPIVIDFDPDHGKTRIRLERILVEFNVPRRDIKWARVGDGNDLQRLTLELHLQTHHFVEMLDTIVSEPAVKVVEGVPAAIGD